MGRELARDGHDGALLGILAPAFGDQLPMAAQITVWTEGLKDVVRRGDQQASPQRVAALGAAQLRLGVAALGQPRHQTEVRAHVATVVEAGGSAGAPPTLSRRSARD